MKLCLSATSPREGGSVPGNDHTQGPLGICIVLVLKLDINILVRDLLRRTNANSSRDICTYLNNVIMTYFESEEKRIIRNNAAVNKQPWSRRALGMQPARVASPTLQVCLCDMETIIVSRS